MSERLPMSQEGFCSVLEEMISGWKTPIYTDDGNTNANVESVDQKREDGPMIVTLNDGSAFEIVVTKIV